MSSSSQKLRHWDATNLDFCGCDQFKIGNLLLLSNSFFHNQIGMLLWNYRLLNRQSACQLETNPNLEFWVPRYWKLLFCTPWTRFQTHQLEAWSANSIVFDRHGPRVTKVHSYRISTKMPLSNHQKDWNTSRSCSDKGKPEKVMRWRQMLSHPQSPWSS